MKDLLHVSMQLRFFKMLMSRFCRTILSARDSALRLYDYGSRVRFLNQSYYLANFGFSQILVEIQTSIKINCWEN